MNDQNYKLHTKETCRAGIKYVWTTLLHSAAVWYLSSGFAVISISFHNHCCWISASSVARLHGCCCLLGALRSVRSPLPYTQYSVLVSIVGGWGGGPITHGSSQERSTIGPQDSPRGRGIWIGGRGGHYCQKPSDLNIKHRIPLEQSFSTFLALVKIFSFSSPPFHFSSMVVSFCLPLFCSHYYIFCAQELLAIMAGMHASGF